MQRDKKQYLTRAAFLLEIRTAQEIACVRRALFNVVLQRTMQSRRPLASGTRFFACYAQPQRARSRLFTSDAHEGEFEIGEQSS